MRGEGFIEGLDYEVYFYGNWEDVVGDWVIILYRFFLFMIYGRNFFLVLELGIVVFFLSIWVVFFCGYSYFCNWLSFVDFVVCCKV